MHRSNSGEACHNVPGFLQFPCSAPVIEDACIHSIRKAHTNTHPHTMLCHRPKTEQNLTNYKPFARRILGTGLDECFLVHESWANYVKLIFSTQGPGSRHQGQGARRREDVKVLHCNIHGKHNCQGKMEQDKWLQAKSLVRKGRRPWQEWPPTRSLTNMAYHDNGTEEEPAIQPM